MKPNTMIWKSGCVKRWHSSIDNNLRNSGDTTGEHSHRVALLLLMLNPLPSAHLLACALTHDTPEIMTGDMPGPMKQGPMKELMGKYEDELAESLSLPVPSDKDKAWITLCDKLDAILWVREHSPYALWADAWIEEWERVVTIASTLGVMEKVEELLGHDTFKADRRSS